MNTPRSKTVSRSGACALIAVLSACGGSRAPEHEHDDRQQLDTQSGGGDATFLDVPPDLANNLGLTFAAIERRDVHESLRIPGRIELMPSATREHRVAVEGRVRLKVRQYDTARAGDVLLVIESPEWRRMQHDTVEAEGEIEVARAQLDVAIAKRDETEREITVITERIDSLNAAGSRNANLDAQRSLAETRRPRLAAEEAAARVRLAEAHEHLQSRARMLAAVTGLPVSQLLAKTPSASSDGSTTTHYRTIEDLPYTSEIDGVVQEIMVTEGGWLNAGDLALVIVQPSDLRFRGDALTQTLPDGDVDSRAIRVVPPRRATSSIASLDTAARSWSGTFVRAPLADPHTRTVPVFVELAENEDRPSWIQAGVQAFLEIDLRRAVAGDGGGGVAEAGIAIPKDALVRDGLVTFFYVRQADDPDHLHKVTAKLGADDGWFVEIYNDLAPGREVVVRGAGALHLAGGGTARQKAPPGFHYHADGSLHADH